MNFGVIFLCFLIGCVIGFEIGKAVMITKVREILSDLSGFLKKAAEENQKKRDANIAKEENTK